MGERIGLIAGNGQFPILFARAAKARDYEVVAIAVREETRPELAGLVSRIYWIGLGQMKEFFQIIQKEGLKKAVMAGQIKPARIFEKNLAQDESLQRFLKQVKDKRADSLLSEIARMLKRIGVRLIDSTTFLKDYLVPRGVLTTLSPTPEQWQDIKFGENIAKRIAGIDVGQTVVVKNKAILAIEAIEGTDEAIKRGGALGGGRVVAVKVSKPRQDKRFDIPIIGPATIDALISAGCVLLAAEAGKTLLLDREKCLRIAEENNICLVGI